jgi:hypothetical protein
LTIDHCWESLGHSKHWFYPRESNSELAFDWFTFIVSYNDSRLLFQFSSDVNLISEPEHVCRFYGTNISPNVDMEWIALDITLSHGH